MRNDQPKIKKELRDLKAAVDLLQRKIIMREIAIENLERKSAALEEDVLIYNIEYKRLLDNKPALTLRYFVARVLTEELNALERITVHDPFIA